MPADFTRESQFQSWLNRVAKKYEWLNNHDTNSRMNKGRAGFPDSCLSQREWLIFAELKMPDGVLSDKQVEWIYNLYIANQWVDVWYPDDTPYVESTLMNPSLGYGTYLANRRASIGIMLKQHGYNIKGH